ncbi:hypothetical protein Hanom_Chr07g00628831 [Helianthus anomalus]
MDGRMCALSPLIYGLSCSSYLHVDMLTNFERLSSQQLRLKGSRRRDIAA